MRRALENEANNRILYPCHEKQPEKGIHSLPPRPNPMPQPPMHCPQKRGQANVAKEQNTEKKINDQSDHLRLHQQKIDGISDME